MTSKLLKISHVVDGKTKGRFPHPKRGFNHSIGQRKIRFVKFSVKAEGDVESSIVKYKAVRNSVRMKFEDLENIISHNRYS